MFCPLCQAEYREGFHRCKDCDVELVVSLAPETIPKDDDSVEVLWRGHDPAVHSALVTALDESGIQFHDAASNSPEAGNSSFPIGELEGPGFAVSVFGIDLERARAALVAVLEQLASEQAVKIARHSVGGLRDSTEEQSPVQNESNDDWSREAEAGLPEEVQPQEATIEIWSGENPTTSQFIADTLSENGMVCRMETLEEGAHSLFVRPDDESRAHEILREIIEGTPPA